MPGLCMDQSAAPTCSIPLLQMPGEAMPGETLRVFVGFFYLIHL